ncbi:patatin-like phospholipase family protein [Arthrobacter sp. PsM3]|uniref:patatin-like phospholipase family protein n=1 Tax=Arthrobacter sp. PsM3 TaxID=3030531 RepID=UPI00263B0A3E|nr:patatin-like phospholipase family protein [Arthrobacter sp. PsM3]MDN4646377.1 patatin-like phospholipase family protein [Arthrobacter sp. PsM3]
MSDRYISFAEEYLRATVPPPIPPDQIRCLALEGGGGKGNAYLGALYALDNLGVLNQLETVAGSSAGAITALTLSLGMRPAEIYTFLDSTDFASFFDDVSDSRPTQGAPYSRASAGEQLSRRTVAAGIRSKLVGPFLIAGLYQAARRAFQSLQKSALEAVLAVQFRVEDIAHEINRLYMGPGAGAPPLPEQAATDKEPTLTLQQKLLAKLADSWPEYGTSLAWDMGLFSGETARDTFAGLIGAHYGKQKSGPDPVPSSDATAFGRSVTFAALDAYCTTMRLPKLRVTGSELCSTQSMIFSGTTTPNFPVADAVRISMGLPIAYKPYTIQSTNDGMPPCGVYVDGGVYSNLPLNAFSDQEATTAIGLRLEVDKAQPIYGFLGFLGAILKGAVLAGESTITTERSKRCIRLDTAPLETLGFEVSAETLKSVTARSQLTTMLYFGRGDAYAPVDFTTGSPLQGQAATAASKMAWADLEKSIKDRQEAAGCVFQS